MRPYRNPQNAYQERENSLYINAQRLLPNHERSICWMFAANTDLSGWEEWVGPDFPDPLAPIEGQVNDGVQIRWDNGLAQALQQPFPPLRRNRGPDGLENDVKSLKLFPELNLNKLSGQEIPRDITLPPFKIEYDSHEQINQKLNSTVILIQNVPFYVRQTIDMGKGKFALVVSGNIDGGNHVVKYDDVKDCRGIAPGYFMYRGAALWIYRVPERQNSQGMSARNTHYKTAGSKQVGNASHGLLLQALSAVKEVSYAPNLHDVIIGGGTSSLRLSNRVALYQTNKKGAPIGVEYCGRPLGLIVNEAVKVHDVLDLQPSWIHKDLHKVNLLMGE